MDENIDFYIINKLKQYGHEICVAKRGTDDFSILLYAIEENAVIITHDQDFERLVIKEGKSCKGIIWVRLDNPNRLEEITAKLARLVKVHEKKLATSFITLSLDSMYIKKLKEEAMAYATSSDELRYVVAYKDDWLSLEDFLALE
ncbi:MAG TPA: DUF5615 family PIN-like protein [Ktedonobacteraceae bacterium]|nr:DUF5615 family PIN-like protein [Ktedonobacteraceae bacterium]